MKMIIRKVQTRDLEQLEKISFESFPNEEVFLLVNSLIDSEHFYIAEDREQRKIIGFIIFSLYSNNIAHIMILAIDPSFQHQGIGTKLLEFAHNIIEKAELSKVRLEVRIDNKPAIDFYKKHDYHIISKIEKYYDDGSDAFLMIKEIKKE